MGRPVIGICTALEPAVWGAWSQPAHLLPREYADAVTRAGGRPVLLPTPPDDHPEQDADGLLDLLDGLILAGGADVDPGAYGAEVEEQTKGTCPPRDAFEIALTRAAVARDLPLLGICRGMQVLNVAAGGTLHQHLPDTVGHEEHRRTLGSFADNDHDVRLTGGSQVAELAGETHHVTKSHHHQGVDRLGDGLRATGWSELDELVEAVEMPGRRLVVGVQWHPEVDETSRLIAGFVARVAGPVTAA